MMERQNYGTPPDFWEVINGEFDFQLDAAASAENAKCIRYLTETQDALSQPWIHPERGVFRVWCNPPFKRMMPWVEHVAIQAQPDAKCAALKRG